MMLCKCLEALDGGCCGSTWHYYFRRFIWPRNSPSRGPQRGGLPMPTDPHVTGRVWLDPTSDLPTSGCPPSAGVYHQQDHSSLGRQMGDAGSTAVCAFNLEDIESVFNGKYKELNKESSRWMTYSDAVPEPRPGSVSITCFTHLTPRHEDVCRRMTLQDRFGVKPGGWNSGHLGSIPTGAADFGQGT